MFSAISSLYTIFFILPSRSPHPLPLPSIVGPPGAPVTFRVPIADFATPVAAESRSAPAPFQPAPGLRLHRRRRALVIPAPD
jgi:hypothetical protein